VHDRALTVDDVITATRSVLRRKRTEEVRVDPGSRFDSLGIDSLEMIEILIAIEDATGAVIPDSELPDVKTISDLASCHATRLQDTGASQYRM